MKDIIDQSYSVLSRLDVSGNEIRKLVFLTREIETSELKVLKVFTPIEQKDFLKEV